MADSLRSVLSSTDNTAPSIQASASALMRLYDKSAPAAVSEWRNTLHSCSPATCLPLLYVANEVLQTSKRNRGNKFLEAFSPVLKSALIFLCQKSGDVEKVRRVVKIWGDRRVFSLRFVGGLLASLDQFRVKPQTSPQQQHQSPGKPQPPVQLGPVTTDEEDQQELPYDDDADSPFISSGPTLLNVPVKIDPSVIALDDITPQRGAGLKRRRSEETTVENGLPLITKKKTSTLTPSTMVELLDQYNELYSSTYPSSLGILSSVIPTGIDSDVVVGDDLLLLHKQVVHAIQTVSKQRVTLHGIASSLRDMEENELKGRYFGFLKRSMLVDEEEIQFCNDLEHKLTLWNVVRADAIARRERQRDIQAKQKALDDAEARRKAEEEELNRSLERTVNNSVEAKPGQVWNKDLREYQYLPDHTEESWRD